MRTSSLVSLALLLTTCFTLSAQSPDSDDFKLQGEYTGAALGLQVIATGDGGFDMALYAGGLPGAGWDRSPPQRAEGNSDAVEQLVESRKLKKTERRSPTLGAKAPAGAVVLFDGSEASLAKWQSGAKRTDDGLLIPGVTTRETFRDYSLHAEFQTPFMPNANGQARGNSGIYHQGRYETQVLDSFGLEGKNNEAGGIYEVRDPDLNMCLPPLSWQTYDVDFTAPRFDSSGKKISDARLTVRLNGVVVQNDVRVPGPTRAAPVAEANSPGPIYLQDHGNPVRFRNIWLLPRDADREALRPRVPGFERFFAVNDNSNPGDVSNEVLGGRLLIAQLGCTACHRTDDVALQPKPAPQLGQVGSRIRLDHLVGFIGSPHATKSGTTMPDLMHGLSDDVRAQKVAELVSWLSTTGKLNDRPGDAGALARGDKLYNTIGCVACHGERGSSDSSNDAGSVALGNLTAKYTLDSLSKFLMNPHAVRSGGLMPKLANTLTEARDLACYLLGDAIIVPGAQQFTATVYHGSWDNLPDFDKLTSVKQGTTTGLDLAFAGRDNNFAMRFDAFLPIEQAGDYRFFIGSDDGSRLFIDDEQVVAFDGIHPFSFRRGNKKLDVGVHRLRIEYFEQGGEERLDLEIEGPGLGRAPIAQFVQSTPEATPAKAIVPDKFQAVASLAEAGSQTFQKIGCANCHSLKISEKEFTSTLTPPPLNSLKSMGGCLAAKVPVGLPDYALSPTQRRALTAAVAAINVKLDGSQQTHLTLAGFNCYACHARGTIGGPELVRDKFFTTTKPEMGNEARLPPPLTGVGDKLKPQIIDRIVAEGAKDRPYMLTRMPAFAPSAASSGPAPWIAILREQLVAQDVHAEHKSSAPHVDDAQLVADGRKLVGGTGLACIKCHTYNKRGTPGIQAIDMLTMTERLREDWFHRYMLAPTEYRPGTRMPLSFPEGKSVLGTVLDGNADAQIKAMWLYLSEGAKGKAPSGLEGEAIVLTAEKTPIIYRNFIEGLSPRGIAVGYPEHVNLAWDADRLNLALLWKNDFIDASKHWVGRGPGFQGPLGDFVIKLDAGLPIARLADANAKWPELAKNQSARELGYRFRGYSLNATGQPTFKYEFESLTITDFYQPSKDGFERVLTVKSAAAKQGNGDNFTLRLARGAIQNVDGTFVVNGQLKLTVSGAEARIVEVNGAQELRITLPNATEHRVTTKLRW